MHRTRSSWFLPLRLLACLILSAPAWLDAATPEDLCDAGHLKAVANAAKGKVLCHAKAISKHVAVDPECLAKVDEKFAKAFLKADEKGPCGGRAASVFAGYVNSLTTSAVSATQCQSQGSLCLANSQCCSGTCVNLSCF